MDFPGGLITTTMAVPDTDREKRSERLQAGTTGGACTVAFLLISLFITDCPAFVLFYFLRSWLLPSLRSFFSGYQMPSNEEEGVGLGWSKGIDCPVCHLDRWKDGWQSMDAWMECTKDHTVVLGAAVVSLFLMDDG